MVRAEFEMLQPRHVAMVGGVRKVRAGHSVQRDSSRMGSWTHTQKLELIALVQDHNPCGAADWEVSGWLATEVLLQMTGVPISCTGLAVIQRPAYMCGAPAARLLSLLTLHERSA